MINYSILFTSKGRGARIEVVPWNHDLSKAIKNHDGLFLSNGPGDPQMCLETVQNLKKAGIYILEKIRSFSKPKFKIGIYSKFGQYHRYDITMYDLIHIIQVLIPILILISKMILENVTFHSSSGIGQKLCHFQ